MILVSLCAETIKPVSEGDKIDMSYYLVPGYEVIVINIFSFLTNNHLP